LSPKVREIDRVAVIGAGVMGHGLAWIFAYAGYRVSLMDISPEVLGGAQKRFSYITDLLVEKGLASKRDSDEAVKRITTTTSLREACREVDFVIEAIPQNLDLKRKVYQQLDEACPSHAIIATIQSRISPTRLASATKRPDKILATAFVDPPYVMPVVEVIPGEATSEDTVKKAEMFIKSLGKAPVVAKQPMTMGFIQARLFNALYSEAMDIVESGIATPEEVDFVSNHGVNPKLMVMGIFGGIDHTGLDTTDGSLTYVYENSRNIRYRPFRILREKVAKNLFGLKTGVGFYDWRKEGVEKANRRIDEQLIAVLNAVGRLRKLSE